MKDTDKSKWGGMWNDTVHNFEAHWDTTDFVLERPFASRQMTLDISDAANLRDALDAFLDSTRCPECGKPTSGGDLCTVCALENERYDEIQDYLDNRGESPIYETE